MIALRTWEGRETDAWRDAWNLPHLVVLETIPSTNDVGRALAADGVADFTTIVAEEQTAGRGRMGRPWTSSPGAALLVTVLLRPASRSALAPTAPLRVGLAVATGIERVTGVHVGLKWPNDVLSADGRKLAGVLCEGAVSTNGAPYVVAGIGINVNQTDWTPELRTEATSLCEIVGQPVSRAEILGAILEELRAQAPHVGTPLDARTTQAFHRLDRLFGRPVRVDGAPAGIARGVTPDGALRIAGPDAERLVWSGTIRLDNGSEVSR